MSTVKELAVERFQERVDAAIKNAGSDKMQPLGIYFHSKSSLFPLRDDIEKAIVAKLDDYYNNVAFSKQREEFVEEHEPLPF